MDAKSFYGYTMNRVRINDMEGVQHLQEDKLYTAKIGKGLEKLSLPN